MRKVAIIIVIALCLTGLVQAQEQRRPREVWNEVFTNRQGREFPHNKFWQRRSGGGNPEGLSTSAWGRGGMRFP